MYAVVHAHNYEGAFRLAQLNQQCIRHFYDTTESHITGFSALGTPEDIYIYIYVYIYIYIYT